jgi:hypothetical protein
MPEPVQQVVTITVENGRVIITPPVINVFLGEEVEWVSPEENWEVAFQGDDAGTAVSPFVSETFGPGLQGTPLEEPGLLRAEVATDELPKYLSGLPQEPPGGPTAAPELSGEVRGVEAESDVRNFRYEARVSGLAPRTARVRVFRRVRLANA